MEKRPFCNAFAGQFTFARVPFKRKTFNMSITTTKNPVKRNHYKDAITKNPLERIHRGKKPLERIH